MVGRTIIGEGNAVFSPGSKGFGYTSLPVEARALQRLFRLLVPDNVDAIPEGLLNVLSKLPASKERDFVLREIQQTLNHTPAEKPHLIALAMEIAIENAYKLPNGPSPSSRNGTPSPQPEVNAVSPLTVDNSSTQGDDSPRPTGKTRSTPSMPNNLSYNNKEKTNGKETRNQSNLNSTPDHHGATSGFNQVTPMTLATGTSKQAASPFAAMVSDSGSEESVRELTTPEKSQSKSGGEASDSNSGSDEDIAFVEQVFSRTKNVREQKLLNPQAFWAVLLEGMHLQVVTRTNKVWGRKKIYEIYRLSGPATRNKTQTQMCDGIEMEFRKIFCGGDEEHRLYSSVRDGQLYIQLVIGKTFDYSDERNRSKSGEKKKKKSNEYVFIVTPGSPLLAVTASRAPSNSRFTRYVMTAVDLVLSDNAKLSSNSPLNTYTPARVGDWSGTEPHELLAAAHAAESGTAVGRFAEMASKDTPNCPLTDMEQAAAGNLIDRSREELRLKVGLEHGGELGKMASKVREETGSELVASSSAGVVINHSAADQRGRKRARDENLGRNSRGGHKIRRVQWKWTGMTCAATTCWGDELPSSGKDVANVDTKKCLFKCSIAVEGSNIMEGLRQLMQKGLAKDPLPDFVRDAPGMGLRTITVKHGALQPGSP